MLECGNFCFSMVIDPGPASAVLGTKRTAGGAGRRVADGCVHLPRGAGAHIG